jgi:multidrug efflux pump subunit AcrA (membrane-fusion protein)
MKQGSKALPPHICRKLTIATFMVMLFISCESKTEKTSPLLQNISESVYASGLVKSKGQYQVYATTNGLIGAILVKEGDMLHEGDTLIRITNESSKLNNDNAKLTADYNKLSANQYRLTEATASIELAQSKLKNDSLLLERQRNLWSQNIGTRVELEQRELAFNTATTNYELANLNYRNLKNELEFRSAQSSTNLKISTALKGDYLIKAEVSGRIYKILKEKGEFVTTQNPIAIIGDASEFLIELKVDEYDVARISAGQKLVFTMDSYKGKVFEARVVNIEPLMNEQSRSFTVNAIFVTKPDVLYPNLSVEANIIIQSKLQAITIPRSYLVNDSTVLVNKDEKRKVKTGLKDYEIVEIKSGLTIKDIIYKPNL